MRADLCLRAPLQTEGGVRGLEEPPPLPYVTYVHSESFAACQHRVRAQAETFHLLCVVALQCPGSMEYDACRTGCVDDCDSVQALPGDWSVARGNGSSCMDTPTEGCFCAGGMVLHHGQCVTPDACSQCVDHHGHTYTVSCTRRKT